VLSPEDVEDGPDGSTACSDRLLRPKRFLVGDLAILLRTEPKDDGTCLGGEFGDTDAGDEYGLYEEFELEENV